MLHSADITFVILEKGEKESKIEHKVGLPLEGPTVAADIFSRCIPLVKCHQNNFQACLPSSVL